MRASARSTWRSWVCAATATWPRSSSALARRMMARHWLCTLAALRRVRRSSFRRRRRSSTTLASYALRASSSAWRGRGSEGGQGRAASRKTRGSARIGARRLVRSPRVDRGAGAGSGSGSGARRVVRVATATGRVSKDAAGGSRAREGLGFVSGSRVVPASPPPAPGRASPPPSGADPHP